MTKISKHIFTKIVETQTKSFDRQDENFPKVRTVSKRNFKNVVYLRVVLAALAGGFP